MTEQFYLKSADGAMAIAPEAEIMRVAGELAQAEIIRRGDELDPDKLKALIPAFFAGRDHEVSAVAFLDSRSRLIEFRIMGEGSISQVPVFPREVAKAALANGSTQVVLVHNHPGNQASPSPNDIRATLAMRQALEFFEIAVLDHWIVTGTEIYSMGEHGLLQLPGPFDMIRRLIG
jgi:DNA repair protein RadC